jgi:hypothetical protein
MFTDGPSRKNLTQFRVSDRTGTLTLPPEFSLRPFSQAIETQMKDDNIAEVRVACGNLLETLSRFYQVSRCPLRVLAARPLQVWENWSSELFGDYDPSTMAIRIWMRTAVRKEVTSFGTFLSTLVHEYCHHLDFRLFHFPDSWHTRGFYERSAALYHHARGTPRKKLVWVAVSRERWRIDWRSTNRG